MASAVSEIVNGLFSGLAHFSLKSTKLEVGRHTETSFFGQSTFQIPLPSPESLQIQLLWLLQQ
jgi:hypothetical protein